MFNLPDFMKNANNVYRTKLYIIKQDVFIADDLDGNTHIHSDDVYYLRNKKLDKQFESYYSDRIILNGKRVHTNTNTKRYMK